jgi:hypothetical protein
VVNLAWNGFGYEGALAVGEMVRGNKYLRELDVSNNRINWEGALQIMKGLKENDTLEVLKVMLHHFRIIYLSQINKLQGTRNHYLLV